MASELIERRAALRAMLVERASSSAAGATGTPPRRPAEPGRLRMLIVTGGVAVVVIAASVAALQLSHGAPPPTAGFATSAAPTTVPTPEPTGDGPTTPPPASAAALIAPTGWHRITRARLHEFVATSATLQGNPANAAIWEQQAWLDIRCMADHGFVYDPVANASSDTDRLAGLTPQQVQDYETAMYGPQTDAPYDWRTAGCHGAAVHETGQDHAN